MQKTVVNLLLCQLGIAVFVVVLTGLSPYRHLAFSVLSGALVSILTTAALLLIVRKLPKVLKAQTFYSVMWLCEIMKWVSVTLLTVILLRMRIDALGLVAGFAPTYAGGYFMMLKLK